MKYLILFRELQTIKTIKTRLQWEVEGMEDRSEKSANEQKGFHEMINKVGVEKAIKRKQFYIYFLWAEQSRSEWNTV